MITETETEFSGSPVADFTADYVVDHDADHEIEHDRERVSVLVVGGGDIAVPLAQLTHVLDWECRIVERMNPEVDLDPDDVMVVLTHDTEIAGPALRRALRERLRYVGAVGSRSTQRMRHRWLVEHQVSPLQVAEIYGPAGLDIGASTPTEIAVSIMAELISVLRSSPCCSISRKPAPVGAAAQAAPLS